MKNFGKISIHQFSVTEPKFAEDFRTQSERITIVRTLFTLPSWPVVFKDTCLSSWRIIMSLQNSSLEEGKQTWRKNGEKKQVAMLHTFKTILFEV